MSNKEELLLVCDYEPFIPEELLVTIGHLYYKPRFKYFARLMNFLFKLIGLKLIIELEEA